MNRRQMLVLVAVPSFVTSLGIASVRLTGAAPVTAGACDPGNGCCVVSCASLVADVPQVPAATQGTENCCEVGCCAAPSETPAR